MTTNSTRTLSIYEWNSYSCNNSSDHRLIAKFETSAAAEAMAKELQTLFVLHAEQVEAAEEDDESDWDPFDFEPGPALIEFATKYGGTFEEGLMWGDGGELSEDLPEVTTLGKTLLIYHGYGQGFDGLDGVLEKAGATEVELESGPPWLKFTAKATAGNATALQRAIRNVLEQRETIEYLYEWKLPWDGETLPGGCKADNVAFVPDEHGAVFTVAMGVNAIAAWKAWLEKSGASEVTIELATEAAIAGLQEEEQAATGEALEKQANLELFSASGKSFLFTGKLAAMTRTEAQARVEAIGGTNAKSLNKSLCVLVIGDDGSPLFGQGTKGSKQVKAEKLIESGADLRIISESHFLQLKP